MKNLLKTHLLATALALAWLPVASAAPELDLAPSDTGFTDKSASARVVTCDINSVSHSASDSGPVIGGHAIPARRVGTPGVSVEMKGDDPLNAPAGLSYAALVCFDELRALPQNPVLFGRWQVQPAGRNLAAIFIGADGRLQFLGSVDGTAEGTMGGATSAPVPAGKWVVVAVAWKSETLSYGLYTVEGQPIDEMTLSGPRAPKALYSDDQPLRIGAPPEFGLRLARFQAHGAYLLPADAARALLSTR